MAPLASFWAPAALSSGEEGRPVSGLLLEKITLNSRKVGRSQAPSPGAECRPAAPAASLGPAMP
jgi:hypothetical protein